MSTLTKIIFGILVLFIIVLLYFGYTSKSTDIVEVIPTPKEVNALTFYHWWTSPGESVAIKSLIDVFSKKYPDVAIVAAPVVGGAGFKMFPIINSLISGGEGPDAFQMHAGYEARPFFDADLLSPINYIWESEQLESKIPKVLQDMNKFNGSYYSIPLTVHRSNVVWYNKILLDKYKIDTTKINTWDDLFAIADKLRTEGIQYPIQMGEAWTAAQVFETIIASQGIDTYEDWINGKITSENDERIINASSIFKKYLSYVNKDNVGLAWDEAIRRVIKKESAFSIMGDWANSEFKIVGMRYGKDYGSFLAPGTKSMYGLVVDTFQHPKGVAHITNSDRWLRVVASKEGQDAFNTLKGSISPRNDLDITKYDDYQKSAINDFKNAQYMYPSVVHGSGAPDSFKLKLNEIIAHFVVNQNINENASALSNATKQSISQYNNVWRLK